MPTEPSGDLSTGRVAAAAHAVARLARHVDKTLAPLDLTMAQFRALGLLARGSSGASLLADKLAVSAPNVTGLVDGLVARGLVERAPDPVDRRRQALSLTAKGRKQLQAAEKAVDARLHELAANLGGAEGERLVRALSRWSDALDVALDAKLSTKAGAR